MTNSTTRRYGVCWKAAIWVALTAITWLLVASSQAQDASLPNYLYITDTADPFADNGRIILLDVAQGKVIKVFPAGGDPDFALSPDGSRLYADGFLTAADGRRGPWLSIYETSSGRLLQEDCPTRGFTAYAAGLRPGMDMSPSGRWLYMSKIGAEGDGGYYFYLTAFDTVGSQLLPNQVRYPCSAPVPLVTQQDLNVVIACWDSPFIFDVSLAASSEPTRRLPIKPSTQASEIYANDSSTSIAPSRTGESWGTVFCGLTGRLL